MQRNPRTEEQENGENSSVPLQSVFPTRFPSPNKNQKNNIKLSVVFFLHEQFVGFADFLCNSLHEENLNDGKVALLIKWGTQYCEISDMISSKKKITYNSVKKLDIYQFIRYYNYFPETRFV